MNAPNHQTETIASRMQRRNLEQLEAQIRATKRRKKTRLVLLIIFSGIIIIVSAVPLVLYIVRHWGLRSL